MRHYEVTFIVDPVLSGDEIKSTAKTYQDMLKTEGSEIVHVDEMGLRQLAYPINKRSSGIYFSTEFKDGEEGIIPKLELALRRDERIMRFLTIKLDKYAVQFNEDKRAGKFKKKKKKEEETEAAPAKDAKAAKPKAAPKKEAPKKEAPKAAEPKVAEKKAEPKAAEPKAAAPAPSPSPSSEEE